MQFCIIAPAIGLNRWATKSKAHLVLSHVTNPLYQQFYRQRSEAGDLVILDNSAYEGQMNPNELLERVGLYHPKVVILPDILLGDARESFELAKAFHKTWKSKIPVQWMFVPQSEGDQLNGFHYFLEKAIDEIRPDWIGIPRVYGTNLVPGNSARADLCGWIYNKRPDISVHALGMLAGDTTELPLLEATNCTSIDSSAPVWRGWNGFDIDDKEWDFNGCDVDFDAPPLNGSKRAQLIASNLQKCGVKADA